MKVLECPGIQILNLCNHHLVVAVVVEVIVVA